jgi:hypothetical protein
MSDHGRYGGDVESRSRAYTSDEDRGRSRGRGYSRNSGGIFNYGNPDEDRFRERGRFSDREWRDRGGSDRYARGRHEGEYYGRDDRRDGLPIDETSRLIASNKVEGTAVYGSDNARLGSIYNFMVNKYSGRVEYAVMTYGGFLGMGQRYYPLPWQILTYDTRLGGYRVGMAERDLEDAPSFDRQSEPRFDRQYGEQVYGWYGLDY